MSSRPRRNGTEKSKDSAAEEKNVVELIKGITGASTEDVEFILRECGGNADEATARLVENPSLIFSQVQSKKDKKKKRDEERKSQPPPTTSIDSQRGSYSGRGRGRGRDRGGRGHERSVDRGSRSYDQPTSVDVSFDPPATSGWGSTANESTGGGWDTVTSEKAGNGWDSVATEKPAGRWDTVVAGPAGGQSHQPEDTGVRWDTAATNEGSAAGAWDIVDEQPEQSSKTQTLGTQDAGVPPPVNSTQQPIGQPIVKQAAPAPIRPPNTGSSGPRSMADLFKQTPVSGQQKVGPPPIPLPKAAPTAPIAPAPASSAVPAASAHTPNTPQLASSAGHLDSEDTNGWGPDTADQKIELQGDGLGAGFSGSQKQVQPGSGVIQSGLNPQNAVSRGLPSAPMNQGWQQLEERPSADAWGATHSSAGLGSIGLDPNLHQSYLTDPQVLSQSSWMQQQQPSQPQSLGNAILSSLNQSAAPQGSDHLPILPPTATDLSATSSGFGSNLGQPLAQRLPSNHASQMQFGDFTSQLGNLDLSSEAKQDPIQPSAAAHFASYGQHTLPDLQTGNASSKSSKPGASSLFQPASLSDSSTPQAYGSQGLSQQSQGQQGLRSTTQAPVPAHVAQRALDAFNSAGPHLQGPASQKPAGTAAPETSTASSQTLYNQQAYQPGQTYSQYQYTGAQQPYTAYSNYQQEQEQAQAPTTPQAPAAQKQRGTTSTTSSLSYDPSHFAAYNQQAGQRELSQAAPEFQAQAQKYSGTAQTGGTGSSASHSATTLSQQPGLSQMNQSYSNQLNSMPQSFYSGGQQYSFPQYNNYSQGGAGGYGYGHASGYQGQQAVYNHPAASGYSQAGKYGGGYGATGGYQHGGYGAKEKEHQGTHLSHGLYGQQQLPLGRQHYQGAGVQDHSSYAYQAPSQGYGGYGRQYGQQYYNQNQ